MLMWKIGGVSKNSVIYIYIYYVALDLNPKGSLRASLVEHFNNMFSVFKQHYIHFHTLFNLHVFQKYTNNITQITLSNESLFFQYYW